MPVTRGEDIKVRIWQDGEPTEIWSANSATFDDDESKERENRLGTRRRPSRQTLHGHSGNIVLEVEGPALDDLKDAQIEGYLNGEEIERIDIVRTIRYPAGRGTRVYVYPNAVFSFSDNVSDQDSPVEVTVDWQSDLRERVQ